MTEPLFKIEIGRLEVIYYDLEYQSEGSLRIHEWERKEKSTAVNASLKGKDERAQF